MKNILLVVVVFVSLLILFGCTQTQSSREVLVYGVAFNSKCGFAINSILECADGGIGSANIGKILKVTGTVEKYPCPDPTLQCYSGESFKEVKSVDVVDFNVLPELYSKIDYSLENNKFAFSNSDTGPTVCNRTLVSVGDLNYTNVDLNSVFIHEVNGGAIVHFNTEPSICSCGEVEYLEFDVFSPNVIPFSPDLNKSKVLRKVVLKKAIQDICAN